MWGTIIFVIQKKKKGKNLNMYYSNVNTKMVDAEKYADLLYSAW